MTEPGAFASLVRRLSRDASGIAAVEFALIAVPVLTLLYGCMEVGRMVWTQAALNFATEEAARYASVNAVACQAYPAVTSCATSSQIAAYAAAELSTSSIPASTFTATTATCGQNSNGQKVTASYAYVFVVTGLMPAGPTLKATACF